MSTSTTCGRTKTRQSLQPARMQKTRRSNFVTRAQIGITRATPPPRLVAPNVLMDTLESRADGDMTIPRRHPGGQPTKRPVVVGHVVGRRYGSRTQRTVFLSFLNIVLYITNTRNRATIILSWVCLCRIFLMIVAIAVLIYGVENHMFQDAWAAAQAIAYAKLCLFIVIGFAILD